MQSAKHVAPTRCPLIFAQYWFPKFVSMHLITLSPHIQPQMKDMPDSTGTLISAQGSLNTRLMAYRKWQQKLTVAIAWGAHFISYRYRTESLNFSGTSAPCALVFSNISGPLIFALGQELQAERAFNESSFCCTKWFAGCGASMQTTLFLLVARGWRVKFG